MNDIDSLIAQIPLSQVAQTLDVDERTAGEAVRAAIPALLGGLGANAQDPAGEQSLAQALDRHQGADPAALFDLGAQDQQDGAKIVRHIFGENTGQVVDQLAGARSALGSDMLAKLLPLLAPIVLKWLAAKWSHRSGGAAAPSGSGGVGQAPAGFPTNPGAGTAQPGSDPGSAPHQPGGGLGDLLGGLLGGSGGGLGDLFGELLGRKRH